MELDQWIANVKKGQHPEEHELQILCEYVKEILVEESNVEPVNSPVTVCGDIHGQFHDRMKLLQTGGHVPETNYIFMGDFVDRGYNNLEVFTILLLLKAGVWILRRMPEKVWECKYMAVLYRCF
ncbi:serine threonine-protein phosphatase [Musa troglodytarum]|uniref:protein-serine/threonine phosphatase n=1 Tax=Musa troglodytarum TaxID=320322 RepID=A0A9E7H1U6_9LILI|nr:serine threonine-protein phosphatase [Musa troglodytarum]URE25141.1 serine threonine-protein phosphatase [Musa troglodytarum]URE25143.1 serine threonine-protein phosphatase [Musa troglodytarum]